VRPSPSGGGTDGAGRRPIDTLGRRCVGRFAAWRAKRVRGASGREARARSSVECPGRDKSQGRHQRAAGQHPVESPGTLARDKAQKSAHVGPAHCHRRREYRRARRQVGSTGWKHAGTLPEEKPPKGEPQERCRCETEPARNRGWNPPRGYPNPGGGARREGEPANKRAGDSVSAVGAESPREELIGCGLSARIDWVTL
jgi:hypothetical protein